MKGKPLIKQGAKDKFFLLDTLFFIRLFYFPMTSFSRQVTMTITLPIDFESRSVLLIVAKNLNYWVKYSIKNVLKFNEANFFTAIVPNVSRKLSKKLS